MRDRRGLELNGEVISNLISAAKAKNAADDALLSGIKEICEKARLRTNLSLEEDVLAPIPRRNVKTREGSNR